MPKNSRALEQDLEQEDSDTAAARAGALTQDIPPAHETLKAANLTMLGKVVAQAVPLLSSGQVPELELPPMKDSDAMPPELAIPLMTISAFIDQAKSTIPAIGQYALDPGAMFIDNAGVQDAAHRLSMLMEDKKVLGALSGGASQAAPDEEGAGDAGPDQLSGEG